jgi:hypothetical protein
MLQGSIVVWHVANPRAVTGAESIFNAMTRRSRRGIVPGFWTPYQLSLSLPIADAIVAAFFCGP